MHSKARQKGERLNPELELRRRRSGAEWHHGEDVRTRPAEQVFDSKSAEANQLGRASHALAFEAQPCRAGIGSNGDQWAKAGLRTAGAWGIHQPLPQRKK